MLSKVAVYGAIALAIGIALWTIRQNGYSAGEKAAEARMQKRVEEANAETAKIDERSRSAIEVTNREIESLKTERDVAFDRGRAVIRPVRLCQQSTSNSEVPRVAESTRAGTGAEAELPVRAGQDPATAAAMPDVGPDLLRLAESCQRDNDATVTWAAWYLRQRESR